MKHTLPIYDRDDRTRTATSLLNETPAMASGAVTTLCVVGVGAVLGAIASARPMVDQQAALFSLTSIEVGGIAGAAISMLDAGKGYMRAVRELDIDYSSCVKHVTSFALAAIIACGGGKLLCMEYPDYTAPAHPASAHAVQFDITTPK